MDMQISEEIIFDDVVNEVSISSAAEETVQSKNSLQVGQIQNVPFESTGDLTSSSSVSVAAPTLSNTTTITNKPQPVQYITTIKAPTPTKVISLGTANSNPPNTITRTISFKAVGVSKSTMGDKTTTLTMTSNKNNATQSSSKLTPIKVSAIPFSTSTSNANVSQSPVVTKLIMTSSGQQLVISSPVKSNQSTQANTVTPINLVHSGDSSQPQQLMAIIPISPAKKTNSQTPATPTIRPKPIAIAPSPTITSTPSDNHNKPQQFQMIRLVTAQSPNSSPTVVGTIGQSNHGTTTIKPITANVGGQQKLLIPASALKGLNAGQFIATSTNSSGAQQLIMYTPQIIQQGTTIKTVSPGSAASTPRTSFVPILPSPSTSTTTERTTTISSRILSNGSTNKTSTNEDILSVATAAALSVPPPSRPRKPCNCTRSQCLKLYCDCFANGEFCSNCNCVNCSNNLDHEEERQKAIKLCLERNPHAFHPKIGKGKITAQEGVERRHTKGCNCRRSGCLKNYCECYEAKILCSDLCKCCACKNYEDSYERKNLMHLADAAESRNSQLHNSSGPNAIGASHSFAGKENEPLWSSDFRSKLPILPGGDRVLPCSFITNQVMNATSKCLLEQMESARRKHLNEEQTERLLLEEFGRCLTQIIDRANKKESDQV